MKETFYANYLLERIVVLFLFVLLRESSEETIHRFVTILDEPGNTNSG